MTLYTIIKLKNGLYRPRREYGDRELFPLMQTRRDAIILLEYLTTDAKSGAAGNIGYEVES